MRAVECPCGEYVEAQSDEKLFEETRRHATEAHPDQYQDSELKTLIATSGYDVRNGGS
jgi:hypothetical protein